MAKQRGADQAKVHLGLLPDECYTDTPHATLSLAADKVVTLDRERDQLDKANGSKRRCAAYHNQQAVELNK